MPIDQDGNDISYFSTVKFGSSNKPLRMLLDTGAANSWVMGADCTTKACEKHDTYSGAGSTSYATTGTDWSVSYGTGSVSGQVVNDTVSFAGFTIPLSFGSVTIASDEFTTYPMDGILGLGRIGKSEAKLTTVMGQLAEQGSIKNNLFAMSLSRGADGGTDGEITFGDYNKAKVSGDIVYTDTVTNDGLWEIPLDNAGVDGKPGKFTGKSAIIDSGTSYILLPTADAQKLHDLIPGAEEVGEAFHLPCSNTKSIQLTFSGKSFDISPKDYMGAKGSDGNCVSNIAAHQAFGDDQWLIGDTYLKGVYTIFDLDKHRIGMIPDMESF